MRAARHMAALHRWARMAALLAILVYQPLAALHFATDEGHTASPATFIQVAHPEAHGHHHGPAGGHSDPLCDFCLLAGAALSALPASGILALAWEMGRSPPAADDDRSHKRLKSGHPVRAPPLGV